MLTAHFTESKACSGLFRQHDKDNAGIPVEIGSDGNRGSNQPSRSTIRLTETES